MLTPARTFTLPMTDTTPNACRCVRAPMTAASIISSERSFWSRSRTGSHGQMPSGSVGARGSSTPRRMSQTWRRSKQHLHALSSRSRVYSPSLGGRLSERCQRPFVNTPSLQQRKLETMRRPSDPRQARPRRRPGWLLDERNPSLHDRYASSRRVLSASRAEGTAFVARSASRASERGWHLHPLGMPNSNSTEARRESCPAPRPEIEPTGWQRFSRAECSVRFCEFPR